MKLKNVVDLWLTKCDDLEKAIKSDKVDDKHRKENVRNKEKLINKEGVDKLFALGIKCECRGVEYEAGIPGTVMDIGKSVECYRKSVEYLREAAENEYADAQYKLGEIYLYGNCGIDKNLKESVEYFKNVVESYKKSAAKGNANALYCLGKMYGYGYGVEKDEQKADEYYQKAFNQGDAEIKCMVGQAYEFGNGVEENSKIAAKYYKKAAALGSKQAERNFENISIVLKCLEGAKKKKYLVF